MAKYIIKWQSKLTGKTGQGEPIEIKDETVQDQIEARAMLDRLDKQWPEIKHWLERVEEKTDA